ncbi:MAG TPA: hypothetical protein VJT33_09990 [bacterium]|nr:hypothetical protein [bacterium]
MPQGYVKDVLVETGCLAEYLNNPAVRNAEISENTTLYAQGHIPGALHFNWQTQLQDPVRRGWINQEQVETLPPARVPQR